MKKALLLGMSFAVYGLQAQVGINTTSPQATLDVEGNVRVATLNEDTSADHVVVVGSNNVLSTAPISGLSSGGTTGVISTAISTGKVYTCNRKNNGTIIYTTSGALYCYSPSYSNGNWYYNGLVYGADRSYPSQALITDLRPNIENKWYKISFGLPNVNNVSTSGSSGSFIEFPIGSYKFMSGLPVYFNVNRGNQHKDWSTPPLQVINDSRYKN